MKKFVEIHVLKNYGAGNLNRDISGSPKCVSFGGVVRNRISSQCLNRRVRFSDFFSDIEGIEVLGDRTRKIDTLVLDKLNEMGDYSGKEKEVKKLVSAIGKKEKKDESEDSTSDDSGANTVQLYSSYDIQKMAEILKDYFDGDKVEKFSLEKELAKSNVRPISLDIALFGRMAATTSFTTIEGAVQVAHAMGTHKMRIESDFFTAVDDVVERTDGESGSGHLDDKEFTSNCVYEYFNIDVDSLVKNLKLCGDVSDELVIQIVEKFIQAVCFTHPTGNQNKFASYPNPSAVLVEVKNTKTPLTYQNAFVTPVRNSDSGNIVENSIRVLCKYVDRNDDMFGFTCERFWANLDGFENDAPKNSTTFVNFNEMITGVINTMKG